MNKNYYQLDLHRIIPFFVIFIWILFATKKVSKSDVVKANIYIKQHYLPYLVSQIYDCPKC